MSFVSRFGVGLGSALDRVVGQVGFGGGQAGVGVELGWGLRLFFKGYPAWFFVGCE